MRGNRKVTIALVVSLASCSAPPERSTHASDPNVVAPVDAGQSDPPAPVPWTTEFEPRSILLAEQVTIEGPQGLIDHLYSDTSASHTVSARTLPEGYEQLVEARPDTGERIRAQLDGLRIEAIQRLLVFERVAPCDVRVRAAGDVWWKDVDGNEERGETWERIGVIER